MPPRLLPTLPRPFICPSCQLQVRTTKRFISKTSPRHQVDASSKPTDTPSPHDTLPSTKQKYTHLTSRALIKLSSTDLESDIVGRFLHDLVPASNLIRGLASLYVPDGRPSPRNPIYTVFLKANGRVLQDVFLYPAATEDAITWFIEVDSEQAVPLMAHLRKHKLRTKFVLERVPPEALGVFYAWPEMQLSASQQKQMQLGGADSRPGMGSRWLMAPEAAAQEFASMTGGAPVGVASLQEYKVHRMLNGLAEGQGELINQVALPMESNFDLLGSIDFAKGCYMGQELTIRTHHTGVVRKRILPVQLYDESHSIPKDQGGLVYDPGLKLPIPPAELSVTKESKTGKARSVGKWLGGVGNIGLALCRLEQVTDIKITEESTRFDPEAELSVQWDEDGEGRPGSRIRVRPIVLPWLRERITDSLERRQRRPKKEERQDVEQEEEQVD